MKSLKVFIVLGMILGSFEAFGQSSAALRVLEGDLGRTLLNRAIESNPSAKAFFAGVLGLKPGELDLINPSVHHTLVMSRLNVQGPDQQHLIEVAKAFIKPPFPGRAVDLTLTASEPQSEARPPVKVNVKLGDMTEEKVDAYIVPHFNNRASYDGVGGAVANAGGKAGIESAEDVIHALGKEAEFGSAFLTPSGGGNAPYLLNVISVGSGEQEFQVVTDAVYNALGVAKTKGLKTVAVPALGTGVIGHLSADMSAIAILAGIQEFSNEGRGSVEEVTIVIYGDRDAYDAFLKIIPKAKPAPSAPAIKEAPAAPSSPSTSSGNVGGSGGDNSVRGM